MSEKKKVNFQSGYLKKSHINLNTREYGVRRMRFERENIDQVRTYKTESEFKLL